MMYTYETIDEQVVILTDLGYLGALDDMLLAYYNVSTGETDVSIPDAQYRFLVGEGYTGTIPDMLFANQSLFSTGPSIDDFILLEGGDEILLESGDNLLKE